MDNLKKIEINKFNMKNLQDDATILVIGRRRTGKSWLVRDIFYHRQYIPCGIVFSSTEGVSKFFSYFIPDIFIHAKYNPDIIESILIKQLEKITKAKNNGISESGKCRDNNLFVVLDDMLHEAAQWKKDQTMQNIFFNGRHFNIFFVLTMQYSQSIPPALRSNIDYVFIFNEPNIDTRRKLYQSYGGMIPTFNEFCNILDSTTQNNECLVIKTTGNGMHEQVFYYKAKERKDFRVGSKEFWKYSDKNYNINKQYNDTKDKKQYLDMKKKFGNNNTVKVLVSKSGIKDIVDN